MPASGQRFLKERIIIKSTAENILSMFRQRFGVRGTLSGSIHLYNTPEGALKYAEGVVSDYVRAGKLTEDRIRGMRILEAGPGDNFAAALLFISMGAESVVCVDRFEPLRDKSHELRLYRLLQSRLREKERERFDSAISLSEEDYRLNPERIRYLTGVGLEDAAQALKGEKFDLIVSRAVLRYIHHIDRAFDAMDTLLKRGGMMIHFIDLRDSGTFTFEGSAFHPLTFLTIPGPIWTLMSSHTPRTNRKRVDFYRKKMQKSGCEYEIRVRRVFGSNQLIDAPLSELKKGTHYNEESLQIIREIRPHLAGPFRGLPDEELLPAGIILYARKGEGEELEGGVDEE